MAIETNITLYTEGTPNGLKTTIAMAELDLKYKLVTLDLSKLEQKEDWYLKINPNGRIPAITDIDENGEEIRVFESGAILQYLIDRYDKDHRISYPSGTKEHWEMTSWLMWQMAGLGPMQGQANHLTRTSPDHVRNDPQNYATLRYINETRRLYRVLDARLEDNGGLIVGNKVTIADIAVWPWATATKYSGLKDLTEFPHVEKWLYELLKRPGFEKGRHIPTPHKYLSMNELSEEKMNELSNGSREWIQKSMRQMAQ